MLPKRNSSRKTGGYLMIQMSLSFLEQKNFIKNALNSDNFDDIFTKTPDEISEIALKMSKGQKKSLGYRAIEMINKWS